MSAERWTVFLNHNNNEDKLIVMMDYNLQARENEGEIINVFEL